MVNARTNATLIFHIERENVGRSRKSREHSIGGVIKDTRGPLNGCKIICKLKAIVLPISIAFAGTLDERVSSVRGQARRNCSLAFELKVHRTLSVV